MTLEKLAAEIADDYDGRDPLDPEVVTPVEIGLLYNVTFDVRLDIERAETEFRIRTYGKPKNYLFRLRTVIAVDITAEAQAKQYAKLASRRQTEKRKAERSERATNVKPPTAITPSSYHEHFKTLKANARLQRSAVIAAMEMERWYTINELMDALRHDPAWRHIANHRLKFRQAIIDRINQLRDKGRVQDGYKRGSHGIERVVQRAFGVN